MPMGRVLVADPIEDSAVAKLEAAGLEVVTRNHDTDGPIEEQIKGFDCVVVRSATKITKEVIEASDVLKLVVRAGVGLDNVDKAAADAKGIVVQNTPEAPTVSVAEMVFSLMFSLARKVTQADSSMKNERWEKKKLTGTELWQKTIGIVGFGRIGQEVARRAKSFDMEVLSYGGRNIDTASKEVGARKSDLQTIFEQSDYISIHVPLTPETKGMIGEKEFKKMKKTAFLINTARGGVVDEKALLNALNDGEIAGAALDVFEKEPPVDWQLVKHPKLVATPHLASSTEEAQFRVGDLTVQKVIDGLK
ncbi:hydroxyacid dehydrogenase [Candidatus Thorarchaeota archaeon]|nr:MAG: hydroxyacid dehydrogenase [Candidatus Thorarchaeota archaeon]